MNEETKKLQVVSDAFEELTGEAVDFSAWALEDLVRVLRNPGAVFALLSADADHREAVKAISPEAHAALRAHEENLLRAFDEEILRIEQSVRESLVLKDFEGGTRA